MKQKAMSQLQGTSGRQPASLVFLSFTMAPRFTPLSPSPALTEHPGSGLNLDVTSSLSVLPTYYSSGLWLTSKDPRLQCCPPRVHPKLPISTHAPHVHLVGPSALSLPTPSRTQEGRGGDGAVAASHHHADARLHEGHREVHDLGALLIDGEGANGHVCPLVVHLGVRPGSEEGLPQAGGLPHSSPSPTSSTHQLSQLFPLGSSELHFQY